MMRQALSIEQPAGPGRVVFLKQIHDRPELGSLLKLEVIQYQLRLLKFLMTRRPLHVFVESLIEDLTPDHPQRRGLRRDLARRAFGSSGSFDRLDSTQRHLLLEMGAAFIYAYLHDDVILHRTSTAEEHRKIEALVASEGLGPHWDLVTQGREKSAAREISEFLKANPGDEVCLVFGAFHDFQDDFAPQEAVLECVDFFGSKPA